MTRTLELLYLTMRMIWLHWYKKNQFRVKESPIGKSAVFVFHYIFTGMDLLGNTCYFVRGRKIEFSF